VKGRKEVRIMSLGRSYPLPLVLLGHLLIRGRVSCCLITGNYLKAKSGCLGGSHGDE